MLFVINNKYVEINRYDFTTDKEYYNKIMNLLSSNNENNQNNKSKYSNKTKVKYNTLTHINNLINCK